jgi:hypothetical protein
MLQTPLGGDQRTTSNLRQVEDEEKELEKSGGNDDHDQAAEEKAYLVDWADNDPGNPHNWSTGYRSWHTFQLSVLALAASLASSIIAPTNLVLARHLGVSQEAIVLDVSLYV